VARSFVQPSAAETWTFVHGLGYRPAGHLLKDSTGDIVEPGDVLYPDLNTIQFLFIGRPMSGTAEIS
jgi:hypothetical protein